MKSLQLVEAGDAVTLAAQQRDRAELQRAEYQRLLRQDVIFLETASLALLGSAAVFQGISAGSSFAAAMQAGWSIEAFLSTWSTASTQLAQAFSSLAAAAGTTAQITTTLANYERRRQDWRFQETLAAQDMRIGDRQVVLASDRVRIADQDHAIAVLQTRHAESMVEFIDTRRFGNFALYDWMSGVLQQVYRFFLQQATAMARLAEAQLAFERQEIPAAYVKADYWEPPTLPAASTPGQVVDVRGLTGSARLLRDLYELDQYAFRTDQRKLQLTETISLAQLDPFQFQRFRETGVLRFATPTELFDRRFPGHYLRLIRRVRVSVIALVPPARGIRATLATTGISRVVIGDPAFRSVAVPRPPESVALTAGRQPARRPRRRRPRVQPPPPVRRRLVRPEPSGAGGRPPAPAWSSPSPSSGRTSPPTWSACGSATCCCTSPTSAPTAPSPGSSCAGCTCRATTASPPRPTPTA
jgi:hypothetical protein